MNYVYDGDNVIEALDQNGNVLGRTTQGLGIDEPLVRQSSAATLHYEADGLGSITSLTTTAGAVTATYAYNSFGVSTGTTGSETNPYRYTGREIDARTALHYYRARYYAPNVGRFASEDPMGFMGGRDFYVYTGNEPTLYSDPSGLKTCNLPPVGPHSTLPTPISTCATGSLVDCVIQVESSGNPNARSPKGASGLMQTTPVAFRELRQRRMYQESMSNKDVGITYLNLLLSYCSNVTYALAAYNAGPTAVNKAGGVPRNPETQSYVPKIERCLRAKGFEGSVEDNSATTTPCCNQQGCI